jgi:hypothetical protein
MIDMDAIHTKTRYGGTSTEYEGTTEEATNDESDEDEELYGPFGLLLLLQLIHDLLPYSMECDQFVFLLRHLLFETEEPPVQLCDWRLRGGRFNISWNLTWNRIFSIYHLHYRSICRNHYDHGNFFLKPTCGPTKTIFPA